MMIILLYINFVRSFLCEISVALYSLFNIVIKLEVRFEVCHRRNSVVHFVRVVQHRVFSNSSKCRILHCAFSEFKICV